MSENILKRKKKMNNRTRQKIEQFVDRWLDDHRSPLVTYEPTPEEDIHFRMLFYDILSDYTKHVLNLIAEDENDR